MIKLLIYEDNPQLREGLSLLINGTVGYEVLANFRNCNQVEQEVQAFAPDVILMDIDMPGNDGLEGLKKIRQVDLQVKVLMLTVFDDNEKVFQAIRSGANGYLLKKTPPAKLLEYIQDAYQGGAPMTSSIAAQVLRMFSALPQDRQENYHLT